MCTCWLQLIRRPLLAELFNHSQLSLFLCWISKLGFRCSVSKCRMLLAPHKSSGAVVLGLLKFGNTSFYIKCGVPVQTSVFVCNFNFHVHSEKWIGTQKFDHLRPAYLLYIYT